MKYLICLMLVICWGKTSSQSFEAEASIPDIDVDGFYSIFISPGINVYLNNDFSDIRIYDQQNREVPYLLQKEGLENNVGLFHKSEMVGNEYYPDCCTLLMLHHSDRIPINNVTLVIKNAEATRKAILLGSDDKQHWSTLKDWFYIHGNKNPDETSEVKIAGFPSSNFKYYFLHLNDSIGPPLTILKAGYYGNYTEILPVKTTTSDSVSEKKTFVRLAFDTLQFIDRLEIDVSGVKFYRRKAVLIEKRVRKSKKGNPSVEYRPVRRFELTTGEATVLESLEIRAQELLIEIENDDNPPLTISAVKSFQMNRYLTAWLKKNDQYTIKFGQGNLSAPDYDLAFFKDSIPKQIKAVEPNEINIIKKIDTESPHPFFTRKIIIWVAIVIVILVLGFMSLRLVRESGKAQPKG